VKYFIQFAIISLICLAGQAVSILLPFPFPTSVSGMIILFVLLITKLIKPDNIKETASWLKDNMALYFIPVFVTIIESWDVLKSVFFQVLFICIITTITTFAVTAYTVKAVTKIQNKIRGSKN